MIIYNKNKKTILGYLIVFFVIIIVFIPKDKENYETVLWNYYEKIASNDIGSSSIHELFEMRIKSDSKKRLAILFSIIIFIIVWAELAVGVF